ncbi:hypothetical protein EON65_53190, partial [archaeon]
MSNIEISPESPLSPILYTIQDEKEREQQVEQNIGNESASISKGPFLSVAEFDRLSRKVPPMHMETRSKNKKKRPIYHPLEDGSSPIIPSSKPKSLSKLSINKSGKKSSIKQPSQPSSQQLSEYDSSKEEVSIDSSQREGYKRPRAPTKFFLSTYKKTTKGKWKDNPKPAHLKLQSHIVSSEATSDYKSDRDQTAPHTTASTPNGMENPSLTKRNKDKHDGRTSRLAKNYKLDILSHVASSQPLHPTHDAQPPINTPNAPHSLPQTHIEPIVTLFPSTRPLSSNSNHHQPPPHPPPFKQQPLASEHSTHIRPPPAAPYHMSHHPTPQPSTFPLTPVKPRGIPKPTPTPKASNAKESPSSHTHSQIMSQMSQNTYTQPQTQIQAHHVHVQQPPPRSAHNHLLNHLVTMSVQPRPASSSKTPTPLLTLL